MNALISYPKCGRTWLRTMLSTAIGSPPEGSTGSGCYRWSHRLPGDETENNVIYLVRDPRDVMVSLYFHSKHRSRHPFRGSIADFVRDDPHPRYNLIKLLNHYQAWYDVSLNHPKNFQVLKYEEMLVCPKECVKIACATFSLRTTDELLDAAVEVGKFENMVKIEESLPVEERKCRIGKANNFRKFLSADLIEYIDSQKKQNPFLDVKREEQALKELIDE